MRSLGVPAAGGACLERARISTLPLGEGRNLIVALPALPGSSARGVTSDYLRGARWFRVRGNVSCEAELVMALRGLELPTLRLKTRRHKTVLHRPVRCAVPSLWWDHSPLCA
ncbi:hypothetical protein CIHG_02462 [Coccidioides immitis H538.4]|uniref:Uncharacterized protein n=1 Tax=Coccidioides immitis H538.4 TaxID=396776 RepID=A0A0J8RJ34_COCIT|nr:hypothetical protein CIHG_02462 [Coccidioides immitis H538.4]